MRQSIIFILIVFILFVGQAAFACSCMRLDVPLEEILKVEDAVFVGKILSVEAVKYVFAVRVQIEEAFIGSEPDEITIYTNIGSNACGYNFAVEETYLVYAEKDSSITEMKGGKLSVSKCGRTRPLAEAGEDIQAIKNFLEKTK